MQTEESLLGKEKHKNIHDIHGLESENDFITFFEELFSKTSPKLWFGKLPQVSVRTSFGTVHVFTVEFPGSFSYDSIIVDSDPQEHEMIYFLSGTDTFCNFIEKVRAGIGKHYWIKIF